jgi:hypothetical protein
MTNLPEHVVAMLTRAFYEGFNFTREGFNGECAFEHLAPDGLTLEEKSAITVREILADHDAKLMTKPIILTDKEIEMNDNNEVVTVTLSLTKHQWKDIIQHIMNDASMLEMGLCAQAGRDAVMRITSNALEMANKIKDATGVDVDLAEWKFMYKERIKDK